MPVKPYFHFCYAVSFLQGEGEIVTPTVEQEGLISDGGTPQMEGGCLSVLPSTETTFFLTAAFILEDKGGDLRRWLEASDAHLVADELPLLLVVVLSQQARLVWREVHGVLRDRTGKRVRVHRMWTMSSESSCSRGIRAADLFAFAPFK